MPPVDQRPPTASEVPVRSVPQGNERFIEEMVTEATLVGRVQDSTKTALSDVYVLLGNTRQHTVTDANGYFQITAPSGTYDVVLSHLEYTNVAQQVDAVRR